MENIKTQIEFTEGLYELSESTLAELAGSKYVNDDLRPTTVAERTWTTYNIAMLWVGMVICITGFSYAAALIGLGMAPIPALINVLIGNLIVLIPMQLNSHAGTRYGIPFPIFAKIAFGRAGGNLPALMRTLVAGGWCSVQCWVGGAAFSSIIGCFSSSWEVEGPGRFVGFALFLILTLVLGIRGTEGIKWIEAIGSPVLIALCVGLVVWVIALGNANGISVGDMFFSPGDDAVLAENGGFAMVFMAGVTSNIAVWATLALNIPDFSRYACSQSAQLKGQMIAMPVSVMALAIIGAMFAKVTLEVYGTAEYDPTAVLLHLNSKVLVIVVSLAVILGTITTNMAANVVAPANGFASLNPKRISYRTGVIFTCILCIIYRPWWIFGSAGAFMFTFLGTCGTFLGPVAAVLVADYFVVKQKRVDLKALYDPANDKYNYTSGWNWRAVLSWALGALIPFFCGMASGSVAAFIGANSYIIGFIISFVLYVILMKSEKKSYVSEEEFAAITEKKF